MCFLLSIKLMFLTAHGKSVVPKVNTTLGAWMQQSCRMFLQCTAFPSQCRHLPSTASINLLQTTQPGCWCCLILLSPHNNRRLHLIYVAGNFTHNSYLMRPSLFLSRFMHPIPTHVPTEDVFDGRKCATVPQNQWSYPARPRILAALLYYLHGLFEFNDNLGGFGKSAIKPVFS